MSCVRLSSCIHCFIKFGEQLDCFRELMVSIHNDAHADPHAVGVMKGREVVGHVPHKIPRICAVFKTGQYIKITITGNCHYSHDLLHKFS